VRLEGQLLGVELSEVNDVTVDSAEIPLHDSGHEEQMGGVQGRLCPGQRRCGEGLAGDCGGNGPNAVALDHLILVPIIQITKYADRGRYRYPGLLVRPVEQGRVQQERLEKLRHWESVSHLQGRVPNTPAQTIGTLVDQDVSWDMDDLQLASMKELQALELSDKRSEPRSARGPLSDDVVRHRVVREVEHLVVSEARGGPRFLVEDRWCLRCIHP
jgi:hypothetical protein